MDRYSLAQRVRRGGQITRYHTHALLKPPSNAEHMWHVASLCWQLDPAIDVRTLLTALFHDIAEYDTGDMPAWVKRANPNLKAELGIAEAAALRRMDMEWVCEPTNATHLLVKTADYLDNVLTALDERRRGNAYADSIFHRGVRVTRDKINSLRAMNRGAAIRAGDLLLSAASEYRALVGAERFLEDAARVENGEDYFARMGDTERG